MKGKRLAVWFAVMFVFGVVGLISRLIAGDYNIWTIIGIVSSGIMVISGIFGLIACLNNKER